jgi:hypothetical protein
MKVYKVKTVHKAD